MVGPLLAALVAAGDPVATPYAPAGAHLIDLPTALRLVDENSPAVGLAQARVRQAAARLDAAYALRLPDVTVNTTYLRHDGQIQRSVGDVFTTSRSSVFAGGGLQLGLNTADALYLPLVAARLTDAEAANARAVSNDVQLDVALAHLDLVEVYGRLAVNADVLARAEQTLKAAQDGQAAGLNKTTADVNRAATEVNLRRQEAFDLRARAARVSARLAQLLLLPPTINLRPAEPAVVPVTLVPSECTLEQLVDLAVAGRPELARQRAELEAAGIAVRQAQLSPLLPRLQVDYMAGGFGGGINDDVQNFSGRGDAAVSAAWTVRGRGAGYRAIVRERQAVADQAVWRFTAEQARVGAEVSEAAKAAGLRFATLGAAQEAVRQALEMYRKLRESSFGMIGPRAQFDALEPLLAIQALNQARIQYLTEVVEFNRAQFRLYTAIGRPPVEAMPGAASAVETPVLPDPAAAPPAKK